MVGKLAVLPPPLGPDFMPVFPTFFHMKLQFIIFTWALIPGQKRQCFCCDEGCILSLLKSREYLLLVSVSMPVAGTGTLRRVVFPLLEPIHETLTKESYDDLYILNGGPNL